MYRPIPVYLSVEECASHFESDLDVPAMIIRDRYKLDDLSQIFRLRAGSVSIETLEEVAPRLTSDYRSVFSISPRRANRIYGRRAGAHVDTGANEPVMHVELSERSVLRELRVALAGANIFNASREDPVSFDDAVEALGIPNECYIGRILPGDITLMRHTLHDFQSSGVSRGNGQPSETNVSALRISQ